MNMTYAEFLASLEPYSEFFMENGYPPNNEWITVEADVWCDNPSCMVYMQIFKAPVDANADKSFRVFCGRCNTQMHNVHVTFTDGVFPLNTFIPEIPNEW